MSYARIDAALNKNLQMQQYHTEKIAGQPSIFSQREAIWQSEKNEPHHTVDGSKGLLQILMESEFVAAEPDPIGDAEIARRKRKKRKAEQSQSKGISR